MKNFISDAPIKILLFLIVVFPLVTAHSQGGSESSQPVTQVKPAVDSTIKEELVGKYTSTKEDLAKTELKKRKLLGSLYQINQKMKKVNKERAILSNQMLSAEANTEKLIEIVNTLQGKIKVQRKELKTRVRIL